MVLQLFKHTIQALDVHLDVSSRCLGESNQAPVDEDLEASVLRL